MNTSSSSHIVAPIGERISRREAVRRGCWAGGLLAGSYLTARGQVAAAR